jgi:hypothetical protein
MFLYDINDGEYEFCEVSFNLSKHKKFFPYLIKSIIFINRKECTLLQSSGHNISSAYIQYNNNWYRSLRFINFSEQSLWNEKKIGRRILALDEIFNDEFKS